MAKTPQVPALPGMTPLGIKPRKPASWVIVDRDTGKAIHETWSWRIAQRVRIANRADVVPIHEWLARVNAKAQS